MVRGVGIDMVDIRRIERMLEKNPDGAFFQKVYTEKEQAEAPELSISAACTANNADTSTGNINTGIGGDADLIARRLRARAEYFAGRFAVKEAVFKAVAHLTPSGHFDLRITETLHDKNGCPFITLTGPLAPVLAEAGVTALHVSITTEGDYAAAFVVACRE